MKHLPFTLAFACLATAAMAQFNLGFSAGTNRSFWTWEIKSLNHNIDYLPAMGWRAVVQGDWQITPMLGVQAEFGTQVKVNKLHKTLIFETDFLSGNFNGSPASYREFYQYWEGSLLLQVSPLKKFRHLYLVAGGSSGRLEKAWNKISGTEIGKPFSSKNAIDLKDPNWNRNAFAADFGLGGSIPLDPFSKIKIEVRYQYSLLSLSANANVDARVNSLLFNMGYMHRL